MTKLFLRILIASLMVCGLISCNEDEPVYSCNEEADSWVKSNLSNIRNMTRSSFLEISDPILSKGAYRALSTSQKQTFWTEKLNNALSLNWSKKERDHINNLIEFIRDNQVFSENLSEEQKDKVEEFLFLWEKYALNNLGWNHSTLYGLCVSLSDILDTKGTLPKMPEKVIITNPSCQCSTSSDYCSDKYNRVPEGDISLVVAVCKEGGCQAASSGCGLLLLYKCNGNCNLLNL